MKTKIITFVLVILVGFLFVWPFFSIAFGIIDFSRAAKRQDPIFASLFLSVADGGSAIYFFPGFKLHRNCKIVGETENIKILSGAEIFWNFPWPYSKFFTLENLKIEMR